MAAPLKYLLITLKVVALVKVSFSDRQIPKISVNTLAADEKHYLLNRENLAQAIQMQLSQNQKTFSQFLFAFLKSILNYKHFPKKMTLKADVFPEIPTPKNMV